MGKRKSSVKGCSTHAPVRQFSPMTAVCTCRVSLDPILHAVFTHDVFEYALSCRRPADVPQAHEQYFEFI